MTEADTPVALSGVFDSVDDYIESLCQWELEVQPLIPGGAHASSLIFNSRHISFLNFRYSSASRQVGLATGDGISFFLPERGDGTFIVNNRPRTFDELCCRAQGYDLDMLIPNNFEGYAFRFGRDLLESEGYSSFLQFRGQGEHDFSLDADDAERVRGVLRKVAGILKRKELSVPELAEAVDGIFRSALLPALARVLPSCSCDEVEVSGYGYLERILCCISDKLDEPPTVEELGGLTGVSSRYVQQLFKRYVGMSPKQYIRSMRLNAVRSDLKDARQRRGLVTEIAGNHGFDHLGQFASDYKTLFGELPNETLSEES